LAGGKADSKADTKADTNSSKASSKGEGKKESAGGDFLGTVKGGIHTKLLAFGQKLLQMGKKLVVAGVDKIKGMLSPKVKFKIGSESHELWVEKGKTRNVVMMASGEAEDIHNKGIDSNLDDNVKSEIKGLEEANTVETIPKSKVKGVADKLEKHFEGDINSVQHAVGSSKQAQSVLDGIDQQYFNSNSRFGGGFYVGADSNTIVAELAEHGNIAKYAISYDMNVSGQKVLDLTNPQIALEWSYVQNLTSTKACQNIGELARSQGYNVIKFQSYRRSGINYLIYDNFDSILSPRIVAPAEY